MIVTHDLDTLLSIAERIIVLGNGKVVADGTLAEVTAVDDTWIQSYFSVRATFAAADPRSAHAQPVPGQAPAPHSGSRRGT